MKTPRWHLAWFVGTAVAAFLVPLVGTSVLELQHDLYLLIYFTVVLGLLAAYVSRAGLELGSRFRRMWLVSLAIGTVLGAFQVMNVLDRASTPHPKGAYFVFEIAWRGVAYGVVDVLLLTAFPALVAYTLMHRDLHGLGRKVGFAAATLGLCLVVTTTYHLGYKQYRSDDLGAPLAGNAFITLPAAITSNPLGSIVMHPAMHVAAVVHEYEGDRTLPPTTRGYEERFAGTTAWTIGLAWTALVAAALVWRRRRLAHRPARSNTPSLEGLRAPAGVPKPV